MFFGLFDKKEKDNFLKKFSNAIYISDAAKHEAVVLYAKENANSIFIAWFANTAFTFKKIFLVNNLDENLIVESQSFSAAKYANNKIIFLEHHPLRAKEEALVQNCMQFEFTFYNALTEPIFQYFGGDSIIKMMKRMGYKENEKVQHSVIDDSLLKAQRKIAEHVQLESHTSASQADWMLVNVGSK